MDLIIDVVIRAAILALAVASVDLLLGMVGRFSIAQGAIYGIGAYTVGLALANNLVPYVAAVVLGALLGALVLATVALITVRIEHFYLAIATLAVQVVIVQFLGNAEGVTGGWAGVFGIGRPVLGPIELSATGLLVLTLVVTAAVLFAVHRIQHSSLGLYARAVKCDARLAESYGFGSRGPVVAVFALSGAVAAIAGGLYAVHARFIDPTSFGIETSLLFLIAYFVGGPRWLGALLAGVTLTGIDQAMHLFNLPPSLTGPLPQLVYGALLVLFMLFVPNGLQGAVRALWRRAAGRAEPVHAEPHSVHASAPEGGAP